MLSVPTGIPRVEHAITRFFLQKPAKAQLIYFSYLQNDWIVLTGNQAKDVGTLFSTAISTVTERHYASRLLFGLRSVLSTPRPQDYELHRAVGRITGKNFPGSYQLHKFLFRVLGFATVISKSTISESRRRLARVIKPGDQMLISSVTLMRRPEWALREPYHSCASVILHDTIPLDHPNLVTPKTATRFPNAFRTMITRARRIVCVSHHTMERSLYWGARMGAQGLPKHFVMKTSSPLIETIERTKPYDRLNNRSFVLYCSTIEPRKNHVMLLKAWLSMLMRLGQKAPLLALCGKLGWNYEAMFRFLDQHKELLDKVILINGCDDESLAWLYRHARFTVFPSIDEGWGLAASESLDFGTPAVISRVPALLEATRGLMPAIDANDDLGWADAMVRLCEDSILLDTLRESIKRSYKHWSLDDSLLELEMTLESACSTSFYA